jgi:hypothetical protein
MALGEFEDAIDTTLTSPRTQYRATVLLNLTNSLCRARSSRAKCTPSSTASTPSPIPLRRSEARPPGSSRNVTGRCPTRPGRPTQPICPAPTNPPSIRLAKWSCRSPPVRRRGSACAPRSNPGPRAGVGAPRGWCASWGCAAWSLLAYVSRRLVRLDSSWTQAYYGGKPEATLVIPWRSSDRSDGSPPPRSSFRPMSFHPTSRYVY